MKTGIFYSFSSGKTQWVAERIIKEYGENIESNDIETIEISKIADYDLILIGVSTWLGGGLSDYWDDVIPQLKKVQLKGKRVAIFGLGDQKGYPKNFGDAVGILAGVLEPLGAELLGFTLTEGYQFSKSVAIRNNKFMGLIIDEDVQPAMTTDRIKNWVKQVKEESN